MIEIEARVVQQDGDSTLPHTIRQKTPKTYEQLQEENARLRTKVQNYRLSMKQLQRAHTVTLYQLQVAQAESNAWATSTLSVIDENRVLRKEIQQRDAQRQQARHKRANGTS